MTPTPRLHVCKICGKRFATAKGLCGHQRMHSGLQRIGGLKGKSKVCSVSAPAKETEIIDLERMGLSFMTEIEQPEVIEAAVNLFILSQGVYDFAAIRNLPTRDDFMESMREKNLHCVESKLDDVNDVGKGLLRHLGSKLQKKTQSIYECKICGKSFVCSQALGGHQRLHRSIKGQLAHKKEYAQTLSDSSEAEKTVSQSPSIEISQEEKILHCDKKIVSQTSSLKVTQEEILHCDKMIVLQPSSLELYQAEKILHCDRKNIVSQQASFEVSEDEKTLLCVELKPDFTKGLAHLGLDKSSGCSKTKPSASHSPLRSKSHPSYRFKICSKIFRHSQAQGGHQPLHRSIKSQLAHTEGDNSGKTDSEATVSKPSNFKSQEK